MQITAKLKYLRIAPRKVRLVANLIRGKRIEEAQNILNFTIKKSTRPILKLLNSAVANARNNFQLDSSDLYISKITVDQGPKYKRWRPRARGRVSEIQKKSSHITLVLEKVLHGKKVKKVKKPRKTKEVKKPSVVSQRREKPVKEKEKEKPVKPKLRPEKEIPKPKTERGIKRIFRRKAF